jgi:two-component sensor histidine kinase
MGRRIAGHGWAQTPLGPIETWSPSLRASIEMMLGQKHAICIFWGPERILLYNDDYAPILGAREPQALGRPARDVWHDVWAAIEPLVDRALSGEGTRWEEFPLEMTRNGYPEETFWTFSYSPLYEDGRVAGMMNVAIDVTHGVLARRKQEELQRELVHRVKNSLAITNAIVSSTLRQSANLEEGRTAIAKRLTALNRAQDLMFSTEPARLRATVEAALQAHLDRPERVRLAGPDLDVSANQALGLSLAVYELATNALKYGALSNDGGTVEIAWQVSGDTAFTFSWREDGGPPVEPPEGTGFGSRLTGRVVPAYFSGTGETEFHPDGIRYRLTGQIST